MPLPASAFPLRVSGARILGADGSAPRLLGVNWGGGQQDEGVPYGLDKLPRAQLIERIAEMGLNHVRLLFATSHILTNRGNLVTTPVPSYRVSANPDLAGMTSWQVIQQLTEDLTAAGIYVIVNQHLHYAGWPMAVTTQILTRSGWKHHHEIVPGDETLGYDNGELKWTPILRVQEKGSQQVVRFGSGRWSTICTPDHRWLVQEAFPRNNRPVEWAPVRAEDAFTAWHSKQTPRGIAGARRLVLTGYAEGGSSLCTPDEARVIAWLLTDGNVTWRTDTGGVTAYISQSESKHAAEIRDLLTRENAMTSEATDVHKGMRETVVRRFRIRAAYVRHLWAEYGLEDKDLVRFVLSLSCPARSAFLDAWRKADGSKGQIASHPGPRLDAIAVAAFCEDYLVQEYSGARHHGINLSYKYKPGNGPGSKPVYEDAGVADVWCPTTGLGSWVAKDEDGRIFVTGNCCSSADNNGLWYNDNWPASVFAAVWELIAARFAANPLAGFDLHNEPRPATIGGAVRTPSWGSGWTGPYPTDMRDLYQRTANAIRAAEAAAGAVTHLVFCEGLSYASDLSGWKARPVTGPGIVPSLHDYPWFHPAGQSLTAYYDQMDARAGYLAAQGIAPLWAGEFGCDTDVPDAKFRSGWLPQFVSWAAARGVHACWWELSATGVLGTVPVTNVVHAAPGGREGFGLLSGYDWRGTMTNVLDALAPLMP